MTENAPDLDPNSEYRLQPVGVVRTPYETVDDAPHQGFAADDEAELEVFPAYADCLDGVEDVLRLTVVYWAHKVDSEVDTSGAFARRGPNRPNPINICTCPVFGISGTTVRVSGMDAVDGSPLLDLKPALQAER